MAFMHLNKFFACLVFCAKQPHALLMALVFSFLNYNIVMVFIDIH